VGKIELPFERLFAILRDTVTGLNFYENDLQNAAAALANAFSKSLELDGKQTERATKAADQNRLRRIRDEFTSDPKTITVINPVQSLVYDDDIEVQIRLGNVPASYLGLEKDEQQRVIILLNGSLIPPQAIAVNDPFVNLDTKKMIDPVRIADDQSFGPGDTRITGNIAAIGSSRTSEDGAIASGRFNNTVLPLQAGLRSMAIGRGKSSSLPTIQQSTKISEAGRPVVTSVLTNVLPGRRMTASKRAGLEAALPPATTIQFRADLRHLISGTNTLVVLVIDPGGQRYEQVVSFGVTAAAGAPDDGPALPTAPGRGPQGKVAPNPTGIDLHFDRKAIADRLAEGKKFIFQHSV